MAYYPVFLDVAGRPCLVIGGGEIATRKVEGLLGAGARVTVIAPELSTELRGLAETHEVVHHVRRYERGDLQGAFLAVAATNDPAVHREIAAEAEERHVLLNVVDEPELCGFIAPAVLERGDLQVAVATAGAGPALAARLRDEIAETIGPEYAPVLRVLRKLREWLRSADRPARERRRVLKDLAQSNLPERVRGNDREGIDRLLREIAGPGVTLAGLGIRLD